MRGDHEIIVARVDREVAHGDTRQVPSLESCPAAAVVNGHIEPELGAEEHEFRVDEILLDHVGVATHPAARGHE